ncbi:hypothetical protein RB628_37820 [Streptomyces sp. ADMS]|uniref:hypothetical protein n=1 Tax=Streptomyces sp. ADMS TaxID=3071415 RepID=UPI00296F4696|nr:hypothetical protein [Streptomyces sp. ADMS]MDW4910924.1 hypothetical protein [Streptomyces sp. ADMS]
MAISAFSDARAHRPAADNTMGIQAVLTVLSSQAKAALPAGQAAWGASSAERLGLSWAMVADGPHGVRVQGSAAERRCDLPLRTTGAEEGENVAVRLPCKAPGSGPRTGGEVVQVYAGDVDLRIDRPVRELDAATRSKPTRAVRTR